MPVKLTNHAADDEGDEARIEIIPLIDIMFFLLAAFMLVSLSMTFMRRVPIELPQASTAAAEAKAPPYQIAVDANGVITWEGAIVTPTEITARLKAAGANAETRVMISADTAARHGQVLSVVNAARDAGVEKVNFETKR
ncbi:MAG: biopolymer transporter ExbD [Verrucomicrobia bacterium]|nr:biopolymer transporter ExbD [Verrucomicrobiota bacterium]